MYDVAVIGAGPAGSRVAGRLAELGYEVVVLERQTVVGAAVCCTGIVGQECVNAFAISDDVILRRANSASLFAPSGGSLKLWREEPQACILDRGAFDAAMAARAKASGAQYVMDCPVSDLAVEADGVRVLTARRGEGYRARAAVIASGFGSGLTGRLGLGRVGDFAVGAQAELEMAGVEEMEVYFGDEMAPGFFAWLVPARGGRVRVGLLSRRQPRYYLRKLLDSLRISGRLVSGGEMKVGGVPLKPLERTFAERLLVVGDAAGQVKPTSGGGIYYGLLCADLAADTLRHALQAGDLSVAGLEGYQRAWQQRLGHEMRVGRWARKLYERLSDRQIDRLFDIARDSGIAEELSRAEDISFDWHSRAIMKLMGQRMISGAASVVKMPFRAGGN